MSFARFLRERTEKDKKYPVLAQYLVLSPKLADEIQALFVETVDQIPAASVAAPQFRAGWEEALKEIKDALLFD